MCAGSVLAEVWRGEEPLVVALKGVGVGWTLEGMCATKSDGENVGGRSVVSLQSCVRTRVRCGCWWRWRVPVTPGRSPCTHRQWTERVLHPRVCDQFISPPEVCRQLGECSGGAAAAGRGSGRCRSQSSRYLTVSIMAGQAV